MTDREKKANDQAQKLISRYISECGVDEHSAKKGVLISPNW